MDSVKNTGLIFDVGAHAGEDSDFYLKLGYRVVAVEANPELAAELNERFHDHVESSDYVVVDRAIAESDGTISFFVNQGRSVWGTAVREWAGRNEKVGAVSEEIAVPCVRFANLIAEYGCPHYLKIDIEGADMMCVEGLKEVECRPAYISVESTKTSWSALMKEFNTFAALGYTRFKVQRQGAHKGGPFGGLNGTAVSYSFEKDSSGPFGDHLGGRWLTRRQAILRYVPIFVLYKTIGDDTFLARLCSRVPRAAGALNFIAGWYDTHAAWSEQLAT